MDEHKRQLLCSKETFCDSSIMFVCNKWDVVKDRDSRNRGTEEEVRKATFEKLHTLIPDIRRENIFEISVSQV